MKIATAYSRNGTRDVLYKIVCFGRYNSQIQCIRQTYLPKQTVLYNTPQDGTFNQPKQIMYNLYSAMLNKKCECKRYIKYSSKEREATDDTRIYLFDQGVYRLFKVVEVSEDMVSAVQINTLPWEPLLRVPDFQAVGVFETDGLKDEVQQFCKSQIAGKVVMVGNIACTIPLIVLEEAV